MLKNFKVTIIKNKNGLATEIKLNYFVTFVGIVSSHFHWNTWASIIKFKWYIFINNFSKFFFIQTIEYLPKITVHKLSFL